MQSKGLYALKGAEFVRFLKDVAHRADKNEEIDLEELKRYYESLKYESE